MKLGFFSVAMLLAIKTQGVMLERQQESEIFDLSQVGPESYQSFQPETLAQALAESKASKKKSKCKTDKCPSLRNDMTHIAVTTANNQQVTIDMPMQETKRITVKQNMMVVEDKQISDLPPVEDEKANPVVKPQGVAKPVEMNKSKGGASSSSSSSDSDSSDDKKGDSKAPAAQAPKAAAPVVKDGAPSGSKSNDAKKGGKGGASSSSSSSSSDSDSSNDQKGDSKAPAAKAPKGAAPEAKDGASSDSNDDQKQKQSGKKGGASSSSSSSSSSSDGDKSGGQSGDESTVGDDVIGDAKTKAEAIQFAGKLFDDLDSKDGNKDGNVEIGEVMELVKMDKHSKVDKNMIKEAEKLFEKIDEDGDGSVTKKEFEAFFGSLWDKTKGAKGGDQAQAKAKNESSSGSSSGSSESGDDEAEQELSHIIGDAKSKSEAIQFAGEHFDDLDSKDGEKDGNVAADEIMKLVKSDKHNKVDKSLIKEAENLVKKIDEDGDGMVSKDEFTTVFGSIWEKSRGQGKK